MARNGGEMAAGIRVVDLADSAEIARLLTELGYPTSSEEAENRLTALHGDERHYVAVAEAAVGRLVGWVHVEHRSSIEVGERAELMGLVVDASGRRNGIGRLLVDEAERWARARGLRQVVVRSNVARELSHPFYSAIGYSRSKTQHVYGKTLSEVDHPDEEPAHRPSD